MFNLGNWLRSKFFEIFNFFLNEAIPKVWACGVKKIFLKSLILAFEVMQPHSYTIYLLSICTLFYSITLTIEQFFIYPFSTCASLHRALVSKNALQLSKKNKAVIIQLLDKCLRGNKIAPLQHKCQKGAILLPLSPRTYAAII